MKIVRLLPVAAAVLLPAFSKADQVSAGGVKVEVPAPEGYVRVDGINADHDKSMASALPRTNKLLAVFGTDAAREGLQTGAETNEPRNFNIQVIQPEQSLSAAQFQQMILATEKELAGSMKNMESRVQEVADEAGRAAGEMAETEVTMKMGEMVPLGVFGKGSNWMTYGMRMTMEASAEGKTETTEMLVVASTLNLGPKVLAIYGTDLTGNPDVKDELEEEVENWRKAIFAANPDLMTNTYSGGGFDWSRVGGKAAIGAVIGVAVALLLTIFKKKSAAS